MNLKLYEGPDEAAQYDREVERLPRAGIYQAASWGEVRAETHDTHRLEVRRDGCPVLSAQILSRPLRGGYRILTMPRGPVGDLCDSSALEALFDGVRSLAVRLRAVALLADPCLRDGSLEALQLRSLGMRNRRLEPSMFGGNLPRRVWRVALGPLPGDARGRLRPETRRICTRAENAGLVVREGTAEDWRVLKRWLQEHAQRKHFQLPQEAFLDRLLRVWSGHGQARLHVCEREGRPLSAALSTEFAGEVIGHFTGDDPEARACGANRLLHLHILEDAERRGLRIYDMGGIVWEPGRHPGGAGLRLFKSGFGGDEDSYVGELELVVRPAVYAAIGAASRMSGRHLRW